MRPTFTFVEQLALTEQARQGMRRRTDAMTVLSTSTTACKGRRGKGSRTSVHRTIAVPVEAIEQRRGGSAAEAPSAVGEPPGWRAAAAPCTARGMFARSSPVDGALRRHTTAALTDCVLCAGIYSLESA